MTTTAVAEPTTKERPILFSTEMVRAILDGGKTQTRRFVKPQPQVDHLTLMPLSGELVGVMPDDGTPVGNRPCPKRGWLTCPYGGVGDRLWVRETWKTQGVYPDKGQVHVAWKAGGRDYRNGVENWFDFRAVDRNWRSSIHMFRWASRLDLDITGLRAERLQDISDADVKAEGLKCWTKDGNLYKWGPFKRHVSGENDPVWAWTDMPRSAREAYAMLWNQINGDGAWEENPWVWVVEFKRVGASA